MAQVVHTQAKVIADEDVMFKYISKNLLFVATVSPKATGEIGSVTPEESSLVVYLIDTITGRILHRMTHHGSQGPVHAVSMPFFKFKLLLFEQEEMFMVDYRNDICFFYPLTLKVLSENWVVYHYFNLRAHRYEMSVIEIYDQSRAVYSFSSSFIVFLVMLNCTIFSSNYLSSAG